MRYVLAIMAVVLGLVVTMALEAKAQCGTQSIQQQPLVQRATAADLEALRRSVLSDRQQIAQARVSAPAQQQLVPVQRQQQQQTALTELSIENAGLDLQQQGGCPDGTCPLQQQQQQLQGVQIRSNTRATLPARPDRFTNRATLSRSAALSFVGNRNGQMPVGNVAAR